MIARLHRRIRGLRVTLWTLIVPPTVWAVHFLFSYLWAAVRCAKLGRFAESPAVFWVGTGVALVAILASGWVAWVQARTPGGHPPHESGTDVDRLRFLAYATMLLAGLSVIGVVFTALPVLFLRDCR
jgi:hypothetical protein